MKGLVVEIAASIKHCALLRASPGMFQKTGAAFRIFSRLWSICSPILHRINSHKFVAVATWENRSIQKEDDLQGRLGASDLLQCLSIGDILSDAAALTEIQLHRENTSTTVSMHAALSDQ